MANIKITPLAESDLEEIFEYIAEDNIDSAVRVIGDLSHRFELLADNPLLGRVYDTSFPDLRSFPHKKYVIFYFPIKNGIEIYRVLHGARDFEDLLENYFEGLEP